MLDDLRTEIREIDNQIAHLVAKRLEVAREVGREKEANGLPVRDFGVEKAVLSRMESNAVALGIEPMILEEIALSLIKGAVGVQLAGLKQIKNVSGLTCTIIGGGGQMGGWFDRFISSLGYVINIVEAGHPLGKSVTESDLIIIAVPLSLIREVLEATLALKLRGVVLEIGSLKSPVIDLVKKSVGEGQRVAAIHPMFGPDRDLLTGQNVIICQAGCQEAEEVAVSLFLNTAANLIELSIDKHDRFMTWVLNLPHVINLVMGETLRGSGLTYDQLLATGGTTFNKQMQVTAEVMSENPELYYHIQRLNDHRGELYRVLRSSIDQLMTLSDHPEGAGFTEMMKNWQDYINVPGEKSSERSSQ